MTACDCSSDADGEQMIDMKISCSRHAEMPAHQLLSSSTRERLREIGPLRSQARAKKDASSIVIEPDRSHGAIGKWINGSMDQWHGSV